MEVQSQGITSLSRIFTNESRYSGLKSR